MKKRENKGVLAPEKGEKDWGSSLDCAIGQSNGGMLSLSLSLSRRI